MRLLIIQHVACEGPGLLEEALRQRDWELDLRCMDQAGATLPDDLNNYRGLIILGGPMGAYEEGLYPYLFKVQDLILKAVQTGIPTLGICLGGQLIARALGADVGPNPIKEIGWSPVQLLPEGVKSPLFTGLPMAFSVFQWHQDTFALPPGAVLLAKGEDCENQAFVYGGNVWAMQFHLEVTPQMIEEWAQIYKDELCNHGGPGAGAVLVRNTNARWEAMLAWRERFLQNLNDILARA